MVDGQAGKGSRYRPVDRKKYEANWDRIERDRQRKAQELYDEQVTENTDVRDGSEQE